MATPQSVLQEVFGMSVFRGQQEAIVQAALSGTDVLVCWPTGAGKSLCYQLPAICVAGASVVVSPLVSLMNDQIRALRRHGIECAEYTAALPTQSRQALLMRLGNDLKLLYTSPEQFERSKLLRSTLVELAQTGRLQRIVFDEAHCISEWGQSFR